MKSASRLSALTLLVVLAAGCREDSAAAKMRAIAPRGGRTIEARLTGFAWSPMRVQRSSRGAAPLDPAQLELAGAAGAVIEKAPNTRDAGVGYLIIDRDADAVEALQEAAQQAPNDAKIWSDLAAARYTLAARGDKPYELPRALASADHALRIDPKMADALFNRGLIIEHLGITEAARRAWQRYLQADGTSKWATEALAHLGQLDVGDTRARFERELGRARAALAGGDTALIAALTRTFPQEARTWGEGPLLAEWADAVVAGNDEKAAGALQLVREIARALVETNHEQLLADSVAAIDGATPEQRQTLATAQDVYKKGRILYSQRKVAESDEYLRRSASLFAQANSPMRHVADCYVAHSIFDSNRAAEAQAMLLGVASRIEGKNYRGLMAKIDWELSLTERAAGAWGMSIHYAAEGSRTFGALGEAKNRSDVDLLLADALDRSGQLREGWKLRPSAFRTLSLYGDEIRIATYLATAVRSIRTDRQAALALADVAVDILQRRDPIALSLTHVNRARLLSEADDTTSLARQAVAEARAAAEMISDQALRTRMSALIDIASGMVEQRSEPQRSIGALTTALAFFTAHNDHAALAEIYLQRGRAHARLGDDDAALGDFETGLRELNAQRALLAEDELRSGFYDTEPGLFGETIALHLRHGRTATAFALADGARATSLSEKMADAAPAQSPLISLEQIQGRLAPRQALVEYALLRDGLAIFYATREASGVEIVRLDEGELRRQIDHLDDLLQRRGEVALIERDATALHKTLIAPVARSIGAATELIIVPDRELHALPFGALYDGARRRYLLEDVAIQIAPMAAFIVRQLPPLALSPALVVGDPKNDGPALPDAAREAEAIAAMYPAAILLTGDRATRDHFIESALRSAVVHYSGHAQSDAGSPYGALRLAADDRGDGALEASDIARLRFRNAPLVILSACGTIRGETEHVEGMPSLARAFLAAGARSVIGTLWEIDDDTASRLFRRIHQELRAGQAPAAALRRAQLDMLHDSDARFRHPSTWSPVELLGTAN